MRFEITHHVFVYDTNSFSGACASDLLRILYCTMFFSRHQARRLSPTHRHRTASRRTRLCLTHMYLGGGRPSTHQGHTVSAAASLPVVTPDTEPSVTSSSAPWRQPTY